MIRSQRVNGDRTWCGSSLGEVWLVLLRTGRGKGEVALPLVVPVQAGKLARHEDGDTLAASAFQTKFTFQRLGY